MEACAHTCCNELFRQDGIRDGASRVQEEQFQTPAPNPARGPRVLQGLQADGKQPEQGASGSGGENNSEVQVPPTLAELLSPTKSRNTLSYLQSLSPNQKANLASGLQTILLPPTPPKPPDKHVAQLLSKSAVKSVPALASFDVVEEVVYFFHMCWPRF